MVKMEENEELAYLAFAESKIVHTKLLKSEVKIAYIG